MGLLGIEAAEGAPGSGQRALPIRQTPGALEARKPQAASVGTTSAQILEANPLRKGLVLINTSANTISLGLGHVAVIGSGITLLTGGSWTMDLFTFTTANINAVASAGSSNLAIQEFV